jgi:hypothetical protein
MLTQFLKYIHCHKSIKWIKSVSSRKEINHSVMKITLTCEIEVLEYKEALENNTTGFQRVLARFAHKVPHLKRYYVDKEVVSRIVETLKEEIPISVKEGFEKKGIQTNVRVFVDASSKQIL